MFVDTKPDATKKSCLLTLLQEFLLMYQIDGIFCHVISSQFYNKLGQSSVFFLKNC